MEKKSLFIFILLIISVSLISAIPGIPHQFYGNVEVNGHPSNNILVASIGGEEYSTIINNGIYGVKPNTFFVEDSEGHNSGKTINFFVGGKPAGTYFFESSALTMLDFSLTTTCGDSYCLGEETCSSCEEDCGICTEPPEIFIVSPESKTYNETKIDVNVYSDQEIILWTYSLNSQTPEVFTPNITLTLNDGDYELRIIGIGKNYQSNSNSVSFRVDIPYDYCGDGTCTGPGETCSTCPGDCGGCTVRRSSSGNTGTNNEEDLSLETIDFSTPVDENSGNENSLESSGNTDNEIPSQETNEPKESKKFFSFITGAAISIREGPVIIKILVYALVILIVFFIIFLIIRLRKKKKINPIIPNTINPE